MSISPSSFYRSIIDDPEYRNFEFQPNWIFYSVCFMFAYSIPPIYIFGKITYFFLMNKSEVKKSGIRLEVVYSFLLMQFWNIVLILGDFAMLRIGYTTILTRFCAASNPQALLKIIVFTYFWADYVSQWITVLFCVLRVAILFSVAKETSEKIIRIVPLIFIILGFLAALPNFLSPSFCMQLPEPMPFGSIAILSTFHAEHLSIPYFYLVNYLCVTIMTVVLNFIMLMKIRRKRSAVVAVARSARNAKIERTLTGTMIILLFPMIVGVSIAIGEIFRHANFSYILLIRPFLLDARVHIVTCYFYMTHPIFKDPSL